MSDPNEDIALLAAWGEGDAAAGDKLMKRYYWRVHRFFELRHASAAQDLTQRTLLACLGAAEGFRGASSFSTFMFAIARKQLLDYLRRTAVRQTLDAAIGDPFGNRTQTSVSAVVARSEEHRILLRALAMLPPELGETLQLYYWEGMSAPDIGVVMGAPTSTVTTRLARGRERLRKCFEGLLQPQESTGSTHHVEALLRGVVADDPTER